MRSRTQGPASSTGIVDDKGLVRAWVKTSGLAAPVIDESFGVASITDSGTGLTDVTLMEALGSAEGCAFITKQIDGDTAARSATKVSNTTVPTATVFRIATSDAGGTAADSSGYHMAILGI